jgi:hypothetical protein
MLLSSANRGAAIVVAITLAVTPVLQALPQSQPAAQPKPPGAKPATAAPATAKPTTAKPTGAAAQTAGDRGWPRPYTTPSQGHVVVYEPQISGWTNQKVLVAHAAASYQAKATGADAKPVLGTIKFEADTRVSLDERLVNFAHMRITESNFPSLPKEQLREITDEIAKAIPEDDRVIGLDRVLAFIDKSPILPKEVVGLKADPPAIFFSSTPAIIVNFDGEPIWSPIDKNDLKFAVNTNWDVFEHGPTKAYYLRYNQSWLTTTSLTGAWTPAGKLPGSFAALPASENFKEVKAALPGKPLTAGERPTVNVSLVPAELIVLRGAPAYLVVNGAKELLWVSNTESDVFRLGKTGLVYYLVAGRWFSAPDFKGPWTFATPTLPEDFKRIPLEHERSRVLASVPGTPQAIDALLLAQVPQSARVNKKQIQAPEVGFQGAPEFQKIEGTTLQRAVNTDSDIILFGGTYYYCSQGVWFTSQAATGPWTVATSIPSEIYTIPASSPSHHVTYVVVEEDNDSSDEWVTFAYAAGYTGMMIGWGCAVWGSGWYYPPYAYGGIYYGNFPTYGYAARYNPWTGAYSRGVAAYGPYGGMGASARYNPRTGTYSRGAAAWGPYGAAGAGRAYNPRTGAYGQTRQGSNVYGSWGSTSVQRGDDWAQTNRVTNRATGNTTRVTRTDEGAAVSRRNPGQGGGFVAAGEGGDVYAGRDGNVYRREGDSWQKHENGEWGNVNRPTPQTQGADRAAAGDRASQAGAGTRQVDPATYGQLESDRSSRASGAERTKDYGSARSSGGAASSGSYRGGGASRGGGGRAGGGRRR